MGTLLPAAVAQSMDLLVGELNVFAADLAWRLHSAGRAAGKTVVADSSIQDHRQHAERTDDRGGATTPAEL